MIRYYLNVHFHGQMVKKRGVLVVRASRQLPKSKQSLSLGDFPCGLEKAARQMPVTVKAYVLLGYYVGDLKCHIAGKA